MEILLLDFFLKFYVKARLVLESSYQNLIPDAIRNRLATFLLFHDNRLSLVCHDTPMENL